MMHIYYNHKCGDGFEPILVFATGERRLNGMATVFDAAKFILERKGQMSTMKLQKLCYYAQVWSLVWDDYPLFDEDFEAWANGPV